MWIIEKYKKHKKLSNLTIIFLSLVIAISVNFFILDSSKIGKSLKTNLLESDQKNNLSDLYLEKNNNYIVLKTSKQLNNLKNLNLSFVYNPDNVSLNNFTSNINSNIEKIVNNDWITSIFVNFSEKTTFKKWEVVLRIETTKKENNSEQLNLINSNFTDNSWENFLLSTSWVTF